MQPRRRGIIAAAVLIGAIAASPHVASASDPWNIIEPSAGGLTTALDRSTTDRKDLLLGTDVGGLYRSTDEGLNWTRSNTWIVDDAPGSGTRVPIESSMGVASVAFHPENPDIAYALVGDGKAGGLIQSTDGGVTWARITDGIYGDANSFKSSLWAPISPLPEQTAARPAPRWPRPTGKLIAVDADSDATTAGDQGLLYVGTFGAGVRRYTLNSDGTIASGQGTGTRVSQDDGTEQYVTGVALDDTDGDGTDTLYYAERRHNDTNGDAVIGTSSVWRRQPGDTAPDALTGLPNDVPNTGEQLVGEELRVLAGRLYVVANPADAARPGVPQPGLYWLSNAKTAATTNNFQSRSEWLGNVGETWTTLEAAVGNLGSTGQGKYAQRVIVGRDGSGPILTLTGVPTLANIPASGTAPNQLAGLRDARGGHPLDGIDYNNPLTLPANTTPDQWAASYANGIYWSVSGSGDLADPAAPKLSLLNMVGGPNAGENHALGTPRNFWRYGSTESSADWLDHLLTPADRVTEVADEDVTCRIGAGAAQRLSAFSIARTSLERIATAGSCAPMIRFKDVRALGTNAVADFWYPEPTGIGLLVGTNLAADANTPDRGWITAMDWRLLRIDSSGQSSQVTDIRGASQSGAAGTDDKIAIPAHGLQNGDVVEFSVLTGGAGLLRKTPYYVISATADDFKVATSRNGAAVNIANDYSAVTLATIPEQKANTGYSVATTDDTVSRRVCGGIGNRDGNQFGRIWCTGATDGVGGWSSAPPFAGQTVTASGRPRGVFITPSGSLIAAVEGQGLQRLAVGGTSWSPLRDNATFTVGRQAVRFEARADGQIYAWSPTIGLWRGDGEGSSWVQLIKSWNGSTPVGFGHTTAADEGSLVVDDTTVAGQQCARVYFSRQWRGGANQEGLRVIEDCGQTTLASPAAELASATHVVLPTSPSETPAYRKVSGVTMIDGDLVVAMIHNPTSGTMVVAKPRLWRAELDPTTLGGVTSWTQLGATGPGEFGDVADDISTLTAFGGKVQALLTGGVAGGPATP